MAFATTGAPHALAQQVILGGDTDPLIVGDIDTGDELRIGDTATGTMTIQDGGTVDSGSGVIGANAGSQGTVTVEGHDIGGTASTWSNVGDLVVGYDGRGTLDILDGGVVTNDNATIGIDAGSQGTVTVSGRDINGNASTWTSAGTLTVGIDGNATLNILDGGKVVDTTGIVRDQALVSGQDSLWENSSTLVVDGTLSIEDGAGVTDIDATIGSGASGNAVITGAGTTWVSTGQMNVGSYAGGTLRIEDGASVTSRQGYIGANNNSGGGSGNGAVTVTGTGSNWLITTDGLTIGNDGIGTLTVEDGASVQANGDIQLGNFAGASGTVNLLGTAGHRGVLATSGIWGGAGTADFTFDGGILRATADNASFFSGYGTQTITIDAGGAFIDTNGYAIGIDTELVGAGDLTKDGAGALTLTGTSNSFTGATDVLAGRLRVNGSIANSAVLVHSGAILSGGGTVGATTIASGGSIEPGNSIGTLTVNGNYLQHAGSTYQVEVDPTSASSDRIAVIGQATLDPGATIHVIKTVNAPYILGTRYTILTTTAGLSGTYGLTGETDVSAFIRLVDEYDANNAYLVTRQSRTIDSIGDTPNQIETGTGVDSLPTANPVKTAVLNLPDAVAANHALDQLSGEIHASIKAATIENSHVLRDAATDRIREAFCGVATRSATSKQEARDKDRQRPPADCDAASDRPVIWGQALGTWGHTQTDGNAAELRRSTGGFIAGADATVFDTWRFGILAGYGASSLHVDDRNSSATDDEYYLGIYGGTQWGPIGLRTGATYTWQDIKTHRSVNFSGFDNSLSSDYHAGATQIFGDLGYRIDTTEVTFEPFVNLAYVSLDTKGFSERSGAAALTGAAGNTDTLFSTSGLRASAAFKLDETDVLARGSIGWRHAYADTTPVSRLAFDEGSPFDIAGVPIAGDAAVIDAGLDFAIGRDATLGLSYSGQFSRDAVDQSVRGTFSLRF